MITCQELKDITGGSTNCGWMSEQACLLVEQIIRWHRPDLVIQTGHLWGHSALHILKALDANRDQCEEVSGDETFDLFRRENTRNPIGAKLISIDPAPMGVPNSQAGINTLSSLYPDRFIFSSMDSKSFFTKSCPEVKKAQRIVGIVDGDHTATGCGFDMTNLARLRADIIIVDDTSFIPYLKDICQQFVYHQPYSMIEFPEEQGICILRRLTL